MKPLAVVLGLFLVINLTSGIYYINLGPLGGFKSGKPTATMTPPSGWGETSDPVWASVERDIKMNNAQNMYDGVAIETKANEPVDPKPVTFASKNTLADGRRLIVKRKWFGNSIRDGHRFIFYFYGVRTLGEVTHLMNGELNMDNKYHIVRFKQYGKGCCWVEVRSNFVHLG